MNDNLLLSEVNMAKTIISLIDQEVRRAMRAVIEAEANVAAQKVRVEYAKRKLEEDGPGPSFGTSAEENLRRFEMGRDASKQAFEGWKGIYDYSVRTFLDKK